MSLLVNPSKRTFPGRHDPSEIYYHICNCNEFNFIKNMLELNPHTTIVDKCNIAPEYFFKSLFFLKLSLYHRTKDSKDLLCYIEVLSMN